MKQFSAVVWKELREIRSISLLGLGVFLGFPLLSEVSTYLKYGWNASRDTGQTIALALGWLFAVVVASGVANQDLRGSLERFWRSRPIRPATLMTAKYCLGAFIVLLVTGLPVLLDIATRVATYFDRYEDMFLLMDWPVQFLICHSPSLLLIFSATFALTCLVRKPVEAGILSFAAVLFIYFLPVVIPPLSWLSVPNLLDDTDSVVLMARSQMAGWGNRSTPGIFRIPVGVCELHLSSGCILFLLSTVSGSFSCFLAGIVAVEKGWAVSLEQRRVAWILAFAALFLFGATSFQIGSYLECERLIEWEGDERFVTSLSIHETRGILGFVDSTRTTKAISKGSAFRIQSFDLEAPDIVTGKPILDPWQGGTMRFFRNPPVLWLPETPDRAYYILDEVVPVESPRTNPDRSQLAFCSVALNASPETQTIQRLDLLEVFPNLKNYNENLPRMCHQNHLLYVFGGDVIATLSLSNPDGPEVTGVKVWKDDFRFGLYYREDAESGSLTVRLPPIEEMNPRERLIAWSRLKNVAGCSMAGDLLVKMDTRRLATYRLESIDDEEAVFQEQGVLRLTPLERFFHADSCPSLLHEGFFYLLRSDGVSVFDVRDPRRPKRAGHYAAPAERFCSIAALPNGRVLVAGNNLHILAPPRVD